MWLPVQSPGNIVLSVTSVPWNPTRSAQHLLYGTPLYMLTNFSCARDDACNSQPTPLKRQVTAKPCRAMPKVVSGLCSVSKPSTPNAEFSPLIQEFLEECGYSDR